MTIAWKEILEEEEVVVVVVAASPFSAASFLDAEEITLLLGFYGISVLKGILRGALIGGMITLFCLDRWVLLR